MTPHDSTPTPVPPAQPNDLAKMVEAAAREHIGPLLCEPENECYVSCAFAHAERIKELSAILLRHLQPLAEQHASEIKRLTDQLEHEHNFDVANDAFSNERPPWPKSGEPTPEEAFAYFKKRALEPSDSAIRLAKFIPLDHQFQTIMNPVMLALVKWLDGKESALTAAQEELAMYRESSASLAAKLETASAQKGAEDGKRHAGVFTTDEQGPRPNTCQIVFAGGYCKVVIERDKETGEPIADIYSLEVSNVVMPAVEELERRIDAARAKPEASP